MDGDRQARFLWRDALCIRRLLLTITTGFLLVQVPDTTCQTGMGQYAALPWSLLWLNPSYTGFYGGIGNVGQLTPDSAYLFGAGGQTGGGRGGYNYGIGAYNRVSRTMPSPATCLALLALPTSFFLSAKSLRR